jgi:hypothetical protein
MILKIELRELKNNAICRYASGNCEAIGKNNHKRIPAGTRAVVVSIFGAKGGESAAYCLPCAQKVLAEIPSVINELDSILKCRKLRN